MVTLVEASFVASTTSICIILRQPGPVNPPNLDITGFELTLTQSNAYFTKDGALAFFITEDTAANIGPGQVCRRGRY